MVLILKYLHDWPVVAVYITFTNLLTCCYSNSRETTCSGASGNPQQEEKKVHYCSSRRGYPLTREMGLKCQHLPRLSPSSLALCGPFLTLSRSSIFVYSIFRTEFLVLFGIRHDAHCRSEQLNHPLPGKQLKYSQSPFSFTENTNHFSFFPSMHHKHVPCPNFINS